MITKQIGKIQYVHFGNGGYQEAQFGLWLNLGSKSWACSTSINGGWSMSVKCGEDSKWTEQTRRDDYAKAMVKISELLGQAKVNDVSKLQDIPVEVIFEDNMLKEWRVLEEAL